MQVEVFAKDIVPRKSLNVNSSDWITLASRVPSTSFTYDDLESDKMYTFLVRAENSHGLSSPSPLSEPVTLNPTEKIVEPVIEDKQSREARALLQSGHSAELLDIQPLNATSIKLTWEVSPDARTSWSSFIFVESHFIDCNIDEFFGRYLMLMSWKVSICILVV